MADQRNLLEAQRESRLCEDSEHGSVVTSTEGSPGLTSWQKRHDTWQFESMNDLPWTAPRVGMLLMCLTFLPCPPPSSHDWLMGSTILAIQTDY